MGTESERVTPPVEVGTKAEPPPRPQFDTPEELGFQRQPMVCWLSPKGLAGTGMRVLLSSIFGVYSDKREIQAALQEIQPFDYSNQRELWIDYVSDLGDGFNPTYHLARLLAAEKLELGGQTTPAGQILVMGGDQVYPVASRKFYQDRMVGPYRAALPWGDGSRHLYALPGNHDWYDGLTSFLRVFCQKDWVGGWKTHQSRSYFALQLPHRWWLWGIDIQFDTYIDQPQLDYFDQVVGPLVQPGDSIILCSAKPTWVKSNLNRPEDYVNLDYFDRKIIRKRGAEARLFLTGDTHHYARYVQEDGDRQLLTAGGGGAYLSATHDLPERLELPPAASRDPGKTRPPTHYRLVKTFPSAETSRRLKRRVLALPFTNTGFWALMGIVHVLFGWMAAGALAGGGQGISQRLSNQSVGDLVDVLAHSPIAVAAAVVVVLGLVSFTQEPSPLRRWVIGGIHGLIQLVMIVLTIRLATGLMSGVDGIGYWVGYFAILAVPGGLVGSLVMALYLVVADHWSCNSNELFAAQRIQDYKNFLRLHLAEDGTLTIYPVGIEKISRQWRLVPQGEPSDPWLAPVNPQEPFLIEPPFQLDPPRSQSERRIDA